MVYGALWWLVWFVNFVVFGLRLIYCLGLVVFLMLLFDFFCFAILILFALCLWVDLLVLVGVAGVVACLLLRDYGCVFWFGWFAACDGYSLLRKLVVCFDALWLM